MRIGRVPRELLDWVVDADDQRLIPNPTMEAIQDGGCFLIRP